MPAVISEDKKVSDNKQLIHRMVAQDGGLVSPIDLTLDGVKSLHLEPLQWFNFDVPPSKMKLTNSGDTMVVSGKWIETERPHLKGGPLNANYVFSQVHFHWGSSEHEGSEHTVKGICYPMEMHVVFFKTRYLNLSTALKQDDGVVILVYLFKLQTRSSPGLHWLSRQLEHVLEPTTSSQVSSMPLSSLFVPFDADYITYWGALTSENCQHPVLWLVSRSALAVSSDELTLFRCLLNRKKESMTKNFRSTSPPRGRAIFHINPSSDTNHLLLPGVVDPPCQALIVNYSKVPSPNETEAKKIFSKGDSNELELKDTHKCKEHKEEMLNGKKRVDHDVSSRKNTVQNVKIMNNKQKPSITDSETPGIEISLSHKRTKTATKLQRQCSATRKQLREDNEIQESNAQAQEKMGDCVHMNASKSFFVAAGSLNNENKTCTEMSSEKRINDENQSQKSKLPLSKTKTIKGRPGLQSCYASYFKRPDSAPSRPASVESTVKPTTPQIKKPATPHLKKPAPPNLKKPGTANLKKSGTPNLKKPGTPNLKKPGTPNLNKPATPSPTMKAETQKSNKRRATSTIPKPLTKTSEK